MDHRRHRQTTNHRVGSWSRQEYSWSFPRRQYASEILLRGTRHVDPRLVRTCRNIFGAYEQQRFGDRGLRMRVGKSSGWVVAAPGYAFEGASIQRKETPPMELNYVNMSIL